MAKHITTNINAFHLTLPIVLTIVLLIGQIEAAGNIRTFQQDVLEDLDRIRIFDFFQYTGQDSLMQIKMREMLFIDYFIIVEQEQTDDQNKGRLMFDRRKFMQFANKIIYLPIRKLDNRQKLSTKAKYKKQKQKFTDNAVNQVLKVLAHRQDVIIFSREGDIVKKEAIETFIKDGNSHSCTQLALHVEFLNRISVHDEGLKKGIPNIWVGGAKVVTVSTFMNHFYNETCRVRSQQCNQGDVLTLKNAGWSFIGQKQSETLKTTQQKYAGSYLKDYAMDELNENILPKYVVNQMLYNFQRSILSELTTYLNRERQSLPSSISFPHQQIYSSKRLVFECSPYNGEDHLLLLKGKVGKRYVDYYIITEGHYTHRGVQKALKFNFSLVEEIAHKIIYIPLLNLPSQTQTFDSEQKWANQYYMRDMAYLFLEVMALPQDIVIQTDVDQMISYEAFQQFNPVHDTFASMEMRMFYFYFNRQSFTDRDGLLNYPNKWHSVKVITYKHLQQDFKGKLSSLRKAGCSLNILSSQTENNKAVCYGKVIERAGWHFSYVLNDYYLMRKFSHGADTYATLSGIDAEMQKSLPVAPNSQTRDVGFLNSSLPMQLLSDLLQKKQKSKFALYVSDVMWNSLGIKVNKTYLQQQNVPTLNNNVSQNGKIKMEILKQTHKKQKIGWEIQLTIGIIVKVGVLVVLILVLVVLMCWVKELRAHSQNRVLRELYGKEVTSVMEEDPSPK